MNRILYQCVLDQIKAHPESWDQSCYHTLCGTKHCFAGWAEILAGYSVPNFDNRLTAARVKEALELTVAERNYLFDAYRTIADFEAMLK